TQLVVNIGYTSAVTQLLVDSERLPIEPLRLTIITTSLRQYPESAVPGSATARGGWYPTEGVMDEAGFPVPCSPPVQLGAHMPGDDVGRVEITDSDEVVAGFFPVVDFRYLVLWPVPGTPLPVVGGGLVRLSQQVRLSMWR